MKLLFLLQTAILGMMYIVGIGFGMINSGMYIDFFMTYDPDYYDPLPSVTKFHKMIFSGGLISCIFWVSLKLP